MLKPSGCSNDLAAEVVHFSICWTHEEKPLQKTIPNAFESKPGRKASICAPKTSPSLPSLTSVDFLSCDLVQPPPGSRFKM